MACVGAVPESVIHTTAPPIQYANDQRSSFLKVESKRHENSSFTLEYCTSLTQIFLALARLSGGFGEALPRRLVQVLEAVPLDVADVGGAVTAGAEV